MARTVSNRSFGNQKKKVRAMAGSIKYKWSPTPNGGKRDPGGRKSVPFCDNTTVYYLMVTTPCMLNVIT
jgi:hypothetical protein